MTGENHVYSNSDTESLGDTSAFTLYPQSHDNCSFSPTGYFRNFLVPSELSYSTKYDLGFVTSDLGQSPRCPEDVSRL